MKHFFQLFFFILVSGALAAQGLETFDNIPVANPSSSYGSRQWTGNNGINWTATDARTDLTINGKAILIRNGSLTANSIPNGIGDLSFKHQQEFSGSNPVLQVYVNNNLVGTANPTTSVATATINGINVSGTFNLEIRQVTTGLRIKIDDVTWTANNALPCTTPAAQATALLFAGVTTNSAQVSFTAASPAADKYLVLYGTSNTASLNPANGVTYTAGQALGNTTVAGYTANTNVQLTGLTPGTEYFVFVFAANDVCSGGPLYLTSNPLTGNFSTIALLPCVKPEAAPTTFAAQPGVTTALVGFLPATGADGYLMVLATEPVTGFTPVDGVTYTVGQTAGNGKIAYVGALNGASLTGLIAATTYHVSVHAVASTGCTGGPLYSATTLTGSFVTLATDVPDGYYSSITGLTCAPLKTALAVRTNTGITGIPLNPRTYSDLWIQYLISDVKPREVGPGTSPLVIWDMYSDNPNGLDPYNFTPGPISEGGQQSGGGTANTEGIFYNREHSVPLNWFNSSGNTNPGPATDYLHIVPTDQWVNSLRDSYIFGEVTNPTTTTLNGSKLGPNAFAGLTGTSFEPIDAFKGDFARAFLYFVTRYQANMPNWEGGVNGTQAFDPTTYPSVDLPYLRLMIKWHTQDPVSEKETNRNNAAFGYQGNRNPYIDLPELVNLVWNDNCGLLLPVNLIYFKGTQRGNIAQLQWKLPAGDNAIKFDIERSTNGQNFNAVGTLTANEQHVYNFEDPIDKIGGRRVYYRLKVYYTNKPIDYSDIVTMHLSNNVTFSVFPNPAQRNVTLDFGRNTFSGEIVVTNMAGQRVSGEKVKAVSGSYPITLPVLSSGRYLITLRDADGRVSPIVQSFQIMR